MTSATDKTAKRKAYPQYKSSGVEWLEEIPEHWEVQRLKTVTRFGYGDPLGVDERTGGDVSVYGSNGVVGYHHQANTLAPCLVIGRKGSFGKVSYSPNACHVIDTAFFVDKRLTKHEIRWLYYILVWLRLDAFSKDSAVPGLAREDAYANILALPPLEEQRTIAAFLDRETTRIDTLIAKKQQQLTLLQEKRTALISHAVTKGLDPTVSMKDSGVEWLGEIPEHWQVLAIKRVATRIQTGSTPPTAQQEYYEDGSVPWFGPSSFGNNVILSTPIKLINEKAIADGVGRLFTKDSVMIVGIGATIGKVGYLDANASANQQITAITPHSKKASGRFLAYQLKGFEPILKGIAPVTTLPILDQQVIGGFFCALPTLKEQLDIAQFLEQALGKLDALTSKVTHSITLLQEHRTALISAAVTGKIDVREEV